MLCHVALVRTDVSEEQSASIIRVTSISDVGMLAVTSNRHAVKKYYVRTDILEECSASVIRMTRVGELGTTLAVTSSQHMLRRESHSISSQLHDVTSQKTAFFTVTTIKTKNVTKLLESCIAVEFIGIIACYYIFLHISKRLVVHETDTSNAVQMPVVSYTG
jgi:hypothetical protein